MGKTLIKVKNQQGMVSFIVTLVLMIVITLIVIGFSQISRREQRQALDRQLSTQAFYAAESGVNDAIKAIRTGYVGDGSGNKKTCGADATGAFSGAGYGVIDSTQNIAYTCLLINQGSVPNLGYTVHAGKAISADMKFVSSGGATANAQNVYFRWTVPSVSAQHPDFPAAAPWTVLRVTVTDLTGANPYTRSNLDNNSFTTYLYPGGSAAASVAFSGQGSSAAGLGAQGQIINADCSAGTSCTAGISFSPALSHVFVRVSAIYADTSLTVTADDGTNPLNIVGAQAIIDVTGKAQDVLRRIQVRVPGSTPADLPSDFTVQSVSGICKQLLTNSTSSSDSCP